MGLYVATVRRTRHQRADYIQDTAVAGAGGKPATKAIKDLRAD